MTPPMATVLLFCGILLIVPSADGFHVLPTTRPSRSSCILSLSSPSPVSSALSTSKETPWWKTAVSSFAIVLSASCLDPLSSFAADTLQDQLRVLQALQVDKQKDRLQADEQKESENEENQLVIGKGVVYLTATGLANGVDSSQYPLGFTEATSLDPAFGEEKAAMIITTVGRDGPPLAARKIPLKGLKFPYVFEITDQDLIFPYTTEAWIKSPLSKDSVSLTCILDSDGVLSTPSDVDRFGFAISDPITPLSGIRLAGSKVPKKKSYTEELGLPLRSEAKINVNLKSDGRPYSEEDVEMLSRIDSEMGRLQTVEAQLGQLKQRQPR